MFGCPSVAAIGQSIEKFLPERLGINAARPAPTVHRFSDAAIAARAAAPLGAILGMRATGEEFPVEATVSQMAVSGRKLFTVILRDISERQRAEEARHTLELQLRQAQKMEAIGTLAGGIAHDFNNILSAVLGFSQLALMDAGGNTAAAESIQEVMRAAGRARDLVRQILTFSRQQERERAVIAIQPVVQEAMTLLRAVVPSTIALRWDIDPSTPNILADPSQIHQVVMNLVTNSAHALRDKGGTIEVAVAGTHVTEAMARRHQELHAGLYARLTIKDDGQGMDAAVLPRIFDPFYTTKAPGEGTGLGLSVVHGIIKAHGGAITVESAVNRGATFNIYFPAHLESAPRPIGKPVEPERGRGEHIIAVDDEMGLARFLQRLLERAGYRVTTYTSSEEALAAFQRAPSSFDLLITDLTMPGMTGTSLARAVAAVRPGLPMLLMTGFDATMTPESARQFGFSGMLMKPMPAETLLQAIRRALDHVPE
jgi:signal transduction histidine kinase/ActR/RegA family two-component response regulator